MASYSSHFRNILELNFAMLFISTSGVLGRYIDMPVPVTIGFRGLVAAVLLFLFCRWKKIAFNIASKDRIPLFISGVLMGVHWVTYFYALKYSNIAIGMLSLFTYPVITSFLEPIFLKTKFQNTHILLGGLVLVGIYFLVPNFSIDNTYTKALMFGLCSSICYAIRNVIMKQKVTSYHGSVLMWYQLVIIGVLLLPALFFMDSSGIVHQWPWVLVLALLTTAIGHTVFLFSFKKFSVTTASIISSVQPVYGIILGIVFLREIPMLTTIFGGVLILTSVIIESIRAYKR